MFLLVLSILMIIMPMITIFLLSPKYDENTIPEPKNVSDISGSNTPVPPVITLAQDLNPSSGTFPNPEIFPNPGPSSIINEPTNNYNYIIWIVLAIIIVTIFAGGIFFSRKNKPSSGTNSSGRASNIPPTSSSASNIQPTSTPTSSIGSNIPPTSSSASNIQPTSTNTTGISDNLTKTIRRLSTEIDRNPQKVVKEIMKNPEIPTKTDVKIEAMMVAIQPNKQNIEELKQELTEALEEKVLKSAPNEDIKQLTDIAKLASNSSNSQTREKGRAILEVMSIPKAPPLAKSYSKEFKHKNIRYVMGPVSLTEHYSDLHKKHIYIFGDHHKKVPRPCDTNKSQIHIKYFIQQLIEKNTINGKETDIFLEGFGKKTKIVPGLKSFEELVDQKGIIEERKNKLNKLNKLFYISDIEHKKYHQTIGNPEENIAKYESQLITAEKDYIKEIISDPTNPPEIQETFLNFENINTNIENDDKLTHENKKLQILENDKNMVAQIKQIIRTYVMGATYLMDVNQFLQPNEKVRIHNIDVRFSCDILDNQFVENNIVCLVATLFSALVRLYQLNGIMYGLKEEQKLVSENQDFFNEIVSIQSNEQQTLFKTKYGQKYDEIINSYLELQEKRNIILENIIKSLRANERVKNHIKQMKNYVKDDILNQHIIKFTEKVGIVKQIAKVQDATVRTKLTSRYNIEIDKTFDILKDAIFNWQCIEYNITAVSKLNKLWKDVGDYLMDFMDIYLLARIFKNPNFKYIIIYVGNSHAEKYRHFLNDCGFQLVNKEESNKTCVNIENFQFFDRKF